MNRIELAVRRYRDLIGDDLRAMERVKQYRKMPVARLEAWLTEYVLPAVEEVYERPRFREHATWPERVLVPGAGGAERAAVERVDRP